MKFYKKILNIQKTKTNRLKRKLNKLNKNLSLLVNNNIDNNNNIDKDFTEKIYFISQLMNNLENFIEMVNYNINNKINDKNNKNDKNDKDNEKIKKLIDRDIEAQEIIDKFLPLMLYYQIIK